MTEEADELRARRDLAPRTGQVQASPVRAPGRHEVNETARRVSLVHEQDRLAAVTRLAPTPEGRALTLSETTGFIARQVRDGGDELRAGLLALSVQTQIWLADLDRDSAA